MFRHIGVIGRTVDRKIERNFQPAFSNFLLQPGKILQRSEGGINILVPSAVRTTETPITDGIRHTGIIRLRNNRIVSSFAVSGTNGMDRREINDVKSHGFGILDPGKQLRRFETGSALPFPERGKKSEQTA